MEEKSWIVRCYSVQCSIVKQLLPSGKHFKTLCNQRRKEKTKTAHRIIESRCRKSTQKKNKFEGRKKESTKFFYYWKWRDWELLTTSMTAKSAGMARKRLANRAKNSHRAISVEDDSTTCSRIIQWNSDTIGDQYCNFQFTSNIAIISLFANVDRNQFFVSHWFLSRWHWFFD